MMKSRRLARKDLASRILSSQLELSQLRPGRVTALLRMGLPAKSIAQVEQSTLYQKHPRGLLRPIVEAYSRSGARADAFRVLRDQRPGDVTPYEPLLIECIRNGDDRGLRDAAWMMQDFGVVMRAETYGMLICARLASGEPERALRVAQHAITNGAPPPYPAIDSLIVALSEAGQTTSALEVANTLRVRHGLCLDPASRATHKLLDCAARSSWPLEVLSVLKELSSHIDHVESRGKKSDSKRSDHRIDESSTEVKDLLHDELMQRCVRAGNLAAARALLVEMESVGTVMSEGAIDGFLCALLDDGRIEAIEEATRIAARRWPLSLLGPVDADLDPVLSTGADAARSGTGIDSPSAGSSGLHTDSLTTAAGLATSELPALQLNLRDLPEGVARLCCVKFFQRLANLTPTDVLLQWASDESCNATQQATGPSDDEPHTENSSRRTSSKQSVVHGERVSLLLSNSSLRHAIILQAASLQPPIKLQARKELLKPSLGVRQIKPIPHTEQGSQILLVAGRVELGRWAKQCAEQRVTKSNRTGLVLAAGAHNMLWAVLFVAWSVGIASG